MALCSCNFSKWAVFRSVSSNFLEISILFWILSRMENTYSLWIPSGGLPCARELRTSNLKQWLLFASSANIVFGIERCPTTSFTYFILLMARFLSFERILVFSVLCEIANIESFPQIWRPMEATFSWILSSGLSDAHKLRASNLKHKDSCFHYLQSLFVEGSLVRQRQLYLLVVFFWFARVVFFYVFGLFHFVQYLNRAIWHSMWCRFLDIFILLSGFVVLRRPRSRRGSCQMGYIVPVSWEPPIWNIRTAVSIFCQLCLWKATLSDNLIYVFFIFSTH